MKNIISPKYQMKLIKEIETAIWEEYTTLENVGYYIDKWHIVDEDGWNNSTENFRILKREHGKIDLPATLNNVDGETLIKMAIDLGLNTPDFIPVTASFRNEIKADYKTASATFEKAIKQIETHPDIAISLANAALESIIKEICKDERILSNPSSGKTLYDLTSDLLKELCLFPNANMPIEIKTIGSSLLAMNQAIEKLRSEKTNVHGKTADDYVISDALYSYFIINSVTTIGLFLKSYFIQKFPRPEIKKIADPDDGLPF